MSNKAPIKQACIASLAHKISVLHTMMQEVQNAANNESKSSAGDKHETAKAHAQNETERIGKQLQLLRQMQLELKQIPTDVHSKIQLGTLIETNLVANGLSNFYFSVALGKVVCNEIEYMAVSMNSPLGVLLRNKKAGDSVFLPNGSLCLVKKVH